MGKGSEEQGTNHKFGCEEIAPRLADYFRGAISVRWSKRVAAHLLACRACKEAGQKAAM